MNLEVYLILIQYFDFASCQLISMCCMNTFTYWNKQVAQYMIKPWQRIEEKKYKLNKLYRVERILTIPITLHLSNVILKKMVYIRNYSQSDKIKFKFLYNDSNFYSLLQQIWESYPCEQTSSKSLKYKRKYKQFTKSYLEFIIDIDKLSLIPDRIYYKNQSRKSISIKACQQSYLINYHQNTEIKSISRLICGLTNLTINWDITGTQLDGFNNTLRKIATNNDLFFINDI